VSDNSLSDDFIQNEGYVPWQKTANTKGIEGFLPRYIVEILCKISWNGIIRHAPEIQM